MLRIAMNEPIMAASTAIQVVTLARFGSEAVRSDPGREFGGADMEADRARLAMARSSRNAIRWFGGGCRDVAAGFRSGLDGGDHRHAGTEFDRRVVAGVERDLDRDALHHLGEIAGGVVRRQQREFLAAGGCDA